MNHPLVKFALYSLIGILTMAYAALSSAGKTAVEQWGWFDWVVVFAFPILINLAKDWRSFVDGSYTRAKDQQHDLEGRLTPPKDSTETWKDLEKKPAP